MGVCSLTAYFFTILIITSPHLFFLLFVWLKVISWDWRHSTVKTDRSQTTSQITKSHLLITCPFVFICPCTHTQTVAWKPVIGSIAPPPSFSNLLPGILFSRFFSLFSRNRFELLNFQNIAVFRTFRIQRIRHVFSPLTRQLPSPLSALSICLCLWHDLTSSFQKWYVSTSINRFTRSNHRHHHDLLSFLLFNVWLNLIVSDLFLLQSQIGRKLIPLLDRVLIERFTPQIKSKGSSLVIETDLNCCF